MPPLRCFYIESATRCIYCNITVDLCDIHCTRRCCGIESTARRIHCNIIARRCNTHCSHRCCYAQSAAPCRYTECPTEYRGGKDDRCKAKECNDFKECY